MRKIIVIGLFAAILITCATPAASASAHEFVTSQAKGFVQDKNIGKSVFELALITFECEEEHSFGVTQTKHSTVINQEVEYSKCKFLSLNAEMSQAKYEFKAEGLITVKSGFTLKIPKEGCEIKFPSVGNENLATVTYTNNQQSGTIEQKTAIAGITSTSTGTGSICPKGTSKTGKYKGTSLVEDWECKPVSEGGHFKDSRCREPETEGRFQLVKTWIYWN